MFSKKKLHFLIKPIKPFLLKFKKKKLLRNYLYNYNDG